MARKKKIRSLEEFKSVTPSLLQKIKEEQLDNLEILASSEPFELSNLLGITEVRATKIIQEAKDNLVCFIETGRQVLERRAKIKRLTTGTKAIDNILKGGIETQCIIEFYGEFGSGKTQIMHQLCVTAQLPIEQGGLDSAVLYIDTENTFRPSRIEQICNRFNLNSDDIMDSIYYVRAKTSEEQLLIMDKLVNNIDDIYNASETPKKKDIKLVILDSVISHFRSEYLGRGTLSERQQKLNKLLGACLKFAINQNAIVALTNQVMANPDFIFGGQISKPVGGHILGHASTYRLYLRKAKDTKRIVKIIDSPDLPNAEATFEVTDEGVIDSITED